ncbi:ORF010 [Saltwater crocodilepox virus]|nr:hypothetical protein [Saltwater crocodilepox virus]AVD69347.1 hypothetical protein [Saltwater crocodilepox virus]QGT46449.1 ORF010 [Saltwater crocodilepox virus]QGT46665.1 ORF010 [Saltwater crocodilepox virus]QGT46882.1 ORF010 [Saltwater crocodilepox virus]
MVSSNALGYDVVRSDLSILAFMGDKKAFQEAIDDCERQNEMAWQMTRVLLIVAVFLALLLWLCPTAC